MPTRARTTAPKLVLKDGVGHWWCNGCKCWHPAICPNDAKVIQTKQEGESCIR